MPEVDDTEDVELCDDCGIEIDEDEKCRVCGVCDDCCECEAEIETETEDDDNG